MPDLAVTVILALEADAELLAGEHRGAVAQLHGIARARQRVGDAAVDLVHGVERAGLGRAGGRVEDGQVHDERLAGAGHLHVLRAQAHQCAVRAGGIGCRRQVDLAGHVVPRVGRNPPLARAAGGAVAQHIMGVARVVDLARQRVEAELLNARRAVREGRTAVVGAAGIGRVGVLQVVVVEQLVHHNVAAGARRVGRRAGRVRADADHAQPAGVRVDGHVGVAAGIAGIRHPAVDMVRPQEVAAKHPTQRVLQDPQTVELLDQGVLVVAAGRAAAR